ncbi:hypothetical protein FDECE_16170, partial [Fusarium decemcellulare]
MSVETTVQADVAPGDQTGIYYITICNLPFGTSWQQLKDWTRTACTVEHIAVFQNSTSGWVRVHGKENFDKAWGMQTFGTDCSNPWCLQKKTGLLNGGIFNGRSIIASDKNRSESIKIKELVDPPQTIAQTPRYHPAPSTQYGSLMSTVAPPQYSTATRQYYMTGHSQPTGLNFTNRSLPAQNGTHQPSSTAPAAYVISDPREYHNFGEVNAGANSVENSAVAYSPNYQYQGAQFALPYRGQKEPPAYYPSCSIPRPEAGYQPEYVVTEARKLHVSPFPQQVRADDVKSWIRRKVGKAKIDSIEIPQNNNSKYLRGHVFVIFESTLAANTALGELNKARFQGRRVIARPTVEGVTAADESIVPYEAPDPTECNFTEAPKARIPTGPSRSRGENRHRGEKPSRPRHRSSKGQSSTGSDKKRSTSDKKSSSSGKKSSVPQPRPDKNASSPPNKSSPDKSSSLVTNTDPSPNPDPNPSPS